MAYQQTNATSVDDLIDKIAVFAGANGWTINRNEIAGGGRRATLKTAGTDYVHVWSTGNGNVFLRSSVNYDSAAAGSAQTNQAVSQAAANVGTGPFSNVFLFANNGCVYCVVEIASGIFRHLCFGLLSKFGAYTGGTFFEATNWHTGGPSNWASIWDLQHHHRLFDSWSDQNSNRGGVRCDVDGNVNYFAPFSTRTAYGTPVANGAVGSGDDPDRPADRFQFAFYDRSVNSWSGVTPLQPVKIRVERPNGYWSEIGEVPAVRLVNMSRIQVGDELPVGADTWKVFPMCRKGYSLVSGEQYSSDVALAYLKTV